MASPTAVPSEDGTARNFQIRLLCRCCRALAGYRIRSAGRSRIPSDQLMRTTKPVAGPGMLEMLETHRHMNGAPGHGARTTRQSAA